MYLNKKITKSINSINFFYDIPFFFNNYQGSFYRYEASISHFEEHPILKKKILTFGLNFKFNFKILMSMFFGPVSEELFGKTSTSILYIYLFKNSFRTQGFNKIKNFSKLELFSYSSINMYYEAVMNNLCNFSNNLSDQCLEVRLPLYRFNKITYSGYYNIDAFVSSYDTASIHSDFYNSIGFISSLTSSSQNFFLVGVHALTFSFFVSSFDNSMLFDTK